MIRPAGALAGLAASVAAGLLLWLPGASAHYPPGPEHPCPGGGDAVSVKGAWTVIKAPLKTITTQAAGGPDGKVVLASDGRKVMRSEDGGCTWKDAYADALASVAGAENLPRVSALVFPDGDGSRAFMLLDGVAKSAASRVLTSTDGGKTWAEGGKGLPLAGGIGDLLGYADHLYVTVAPNEALGDHDVTGSSGMLYGSDDGGATWSARGSGQPFLRVAVDPLEHRTLYAVRADHTVQRSDDGGRTWGRLPIAQDPDDVQDPTAPQISNWADVSVARRTASRPATVVLVAKSTRIADVTRVAVSEDGGRSFRDVGVTPLTALDRITFGNSPSQVVAVAGSDSTAFHGPGLYAYDLDRKGWRDVDDLQLDNLREVRPVQLSAAKRGHEGLRALQMRRHDPSGPDVIARYTPPDPPPKDPSLLDRVRCAPANPDAPHVAAPPPAAPPENDPSHRATFTPDALALQLKPGNATRVPIKALLRPAPPPLDVYFLIDRSTSMDDAIDGVRCSVDRLARMLVERGVDAQFGVGSYNDRYEYRYQRHLDLQPYSPKLFDVLQHLYTLDGREEPMRSGLFQTATGAGLKVDDDAQSGDGKRVQTVVPPGQQADFRPGARHVVMVIGDEPYEETTPGEPARDAVVSALKAKSILSVGVHVLPPSVTYKDLGDLGSVQVERDKDRLLERQILLEQQMRFFASGSGAVAPPGGVDCDGGGSPDLRPGDPLVCPVDERGIRESMGDTLVSLLTSFRDTQPVVLKPLKTDGLDVAVDGGDAGALDVYARHDLAATAVVSCTAAQAGHDFDLAFGITVGGRTVGTLDATASCGRKVLPAAAAPRRRAAAPSSNRPSPSPSPSKPSPAPQPAPAPPAAAPASPPQASVLPAPSPPPPSPAPISSPSPAPAPSPAAAPAAMPAAAPAPSPAAALAAAPEREATPQVAVASIHGPDAAPRVAGDHAMVGWRPARATAHEAVPAPALITLGLGVCAGFGWFAWAVGTRRRAPQVERVRR